MTEGICIAIGIAIGFVIGVLVSSSNWLTDCDSLGAHVTANNAVYTCAKKVQP